MVNGRSFVNLDRSASMVQLSDMAYLDPIDASIKFMDMGYDSQFVSLGGADIYILSNPDEVIIACRGTQYS